MATCDMALKRPTSSRWLQSGAAPNQLIIGSDVLLTGLWCCRWLRAANKVSLQLSSVFLTVRTLVGSR
eukprot:10603165-Prorocentrum_lima.AAC.1